jgi:ATP/maltotriose-dependent transcriptional regulator MalT
VLQEALEADRLPVRHVLAKQLWIEAIEAAYDAGELDAFEELLQRPEELRPVDRTPLVEASHARYTALLATLRGDTEGADRATSRAIAGFRDLGTPFFLAVTLLEHAERLVEQGRAPEAEPVLSEAAEIFARLGAAPWLERARRVGSERQPEFVS